MAFASSNENTNAPDTRYAEYSDNFVVQGNIPSLTWPQRPLNALTSEQIAIREVILTKAQEKGLDGQLLARIAYCESGFKMVWNYNNPTGDPNSKWSAYGPFQIVKGHEAKYGNSRMTLEGNIDLAIKIYLQEGTRPWALSKGCWDSDSSF